MAAIKKLAVREENTMVARVQLHNMKQDRDKTICSFGARLRRQASICKFIIKCPTCEVDVNYTWPCRQWNSAGPIRWQEPRYGIRRSLSIRWSERGWQMVCRAPFRYPRGQCIRSQYRRGQQEELKQCKAANNNEPCTYCRRQGHSKNAPPKVRKTGCPAYGVLCDHCNRPNHFETVFCSKTKPRSNHQTPQVVHMVKPRVLYLSPSALQPASTKIGLATSSH